VANENPINDGCCPIMNSDSIGFTLCQAASACMRGCNVGGDITSCFCGTNPASCDQAGQANGPCVAQMTAAAGRNVVTMATDSPNAATVLARQGDPNFALGRASNIQVDAIGFCQVECGF
jgi:hypothetical protein